MVNILTIYIGGIIAFGLYDAFVGAYNNYVWQKNTFIDFSYTWVIEKFILNFLRTSLLGVLWPIWIWYL